MWSLTAISRIEQSWGRWRVLATLANDGVPESFWVMNQTAQPSTPEATTAANVLVASLNEDGAEVEFQAMVLDDVLLALKYQTKAQLADRFRARFRDATKQQTARMATWLLDRITAGDFTDLQVRTAFGLSAAQYTAMKTRLSTLRDHWLAIDVAAGE
jgi:hypothetical protein